MSTTAPESGAFVAAPPLAGGALGWARRLVGPAELAVLDLRGTVRDTSEHAHVRYVGTGSNFRFLADLLFCSFSVRASSRVFAFEAARALAAGSDAQAVLTDLPPIWRPASRFAADIRVPAWVRQHLLLGRQGRVLPRGIESEARRQMRRQDMRVDFTREPAHIARFYHELYRPYVRARFGAQAIVVDEVAFAVESAGRTLGRVFAGSEWVAGMLLDERREVVRFGWYGARVRPALRATSEVLDVACINRAAACGVQHVIMGNSRPSLSDGVLRYKARFGAHIRGTLFPQDQLGISVREAGPALIKVLHDAQLVAIRRGRPWVHRVESDGPRARIRLERWVQP